MTDPPYVSYEDYATTSTTYDASRRAIGLDIITDALRAAPTPLGALRLLDAGCGTGNYLAALHPTVGALIGLEYDPGMLARARQKTAHLPRVTLARGSVFALPLADASVDAIMLNQVTHHLTDPAALDRPTWPNLDRALTECHRVLTPGGALIISTCSHAQLRDALWYAALIPDATRRIQRRHAPIATLEALLATHGFETLPPIPCHQLMMGDRYHDPRGPFDRAYRAGDSVWSLATDPELAAALARLDTLHRTGAYDAFIRERTARRRALGQSTFLHARRRD